jgi:tRNA (adenine22-N1)-methyltransferase
MSLSKRLLRVASFVPEGAYIADVGSDHAQLPLFLLEEKRIIGAEAIENKEGPYERMSRAVGLSPFRDQIALSLSDGISCLNEKVDTVVLAGMGGRLILRILQAGQAKLGSVRYLVVDAHNERPLLIGELGKSSYRLAKASFFYDEGIPYDVMLFEKGKAPTLYSPKECLFGPTHLKGDKNEDFRQYWSKEKERYESLINTGTLTPEVRAKYGELTREIQEVLDEH